MSGSQVTAPARIVRTQLGISPPVTVAPGYVQAPPPGVPPYPLNPSPDQTYYLTYLDGVLAWVETNAQPALPVFALEDAQGLFLLEDGAGFFLLEA